MTDKPTVNGGPSFLKPQMVDPYAMSDDALRRMDHDKWIGTFARVLEVELPNHGRPMTPFRAGAITRLKLAQRYIRLLQHDLQAAEQRIKDGPQTIEDVLEGR
jgi:hypothetical protein